MDTPRVHVPPAWGAGQEREAVQLVQSRDQQASPEESQCGGRSWRLHNHTGLDLVEVAERINPIVRGWMNYYGAFYRSAMYPLLQRINAYLVRWIRKKYKRLRAKKKAFRCWRGIL